MRNLIIIIMGLLFIYSCDSCNWDETTCTQIYIFDQNNENIFFRGDSISVVLDEVRVRTGGLKEELFQEQGDYYITKNDQGEVYDGTGLFIETIMQPKYLDKEIELIISYKNAISDTIFIHNTILQICNSENKYQIGNAYYRYNGIRKVYPGSSWFVGVRIDKTNF